MSNLQIEKNQVLIPCIKLCKALQKRGIIIQYKRLSEMDIDHKIGSPDIEIHIERDLTLWVLMAECKKPIGGVQSKKQINYQNRYIHLKNVVYKLILSKEQLYKEIDKISGKEDSILKGITL